MTNPKNTKKSTKPTMYCKDVEPAFYGTFNNSKLGGRNLKIMGVSYVPAHTPLKFKDGRLVSDCMGTCGAVDCSGCISGCYAIRAYRQYDKVTYRRIANTLHMRRDIVAHFKAIKEACISNGIEVLRYTESGEIETYRQFELLVELARELPHMVVYLYTKNYSVLRRFFAVDTLPANMTVLVSVWGEIGVAEYNEFKDYDGVKCFVVNNDEIKADANCPAYRLNAKGKAVRVKSDAVTCANCKLCTRAKKARVIRCVEH